MGKSMRPKSKALECKKCGTRTFPLTSEYECRNCNPKRFYQQYPVDPNDKHDKSWSPEKKKRTKNKRRKKVKRRKKK